MSLPPNSKSEEAQDTQPILTVFSAVLAAFKELADSAATRDGFVPSFRHEVQRFFLWGQGVSATDHQLDRALIHSQQLRSHVLLILRHLGIRISRCLSLCPDTLDTSLSHEHLRSVLDESGNPHTQSGPPGSPSRHAHSVADVSNAELSRHLGEISAYINCLLDLSPALEHPVSDEQLQSFGQRLLAGKQPFDPSAGSSSIEQPSAQDPASSANLARREYERGKETVTAEKASIEPSPTPENQPVADPAPGPAGHGEQEDPWKHKAVLSFDGGGVRNYWSLLVLQALMREAAVHEKRLDESSRSSFDPCHTPETLSQTNPPSFTPYLPCHYFDYIGGTSTGGLIAILLCQFRITVEDCMMDFEWITQQMLEKPRNLNRIRIPFTARSKYSTTPLNDAVERVIGRRHEEHPLTSDASSIPFRTGLDACRGLALAMVSIAPESSVAPESPVVIRSYLRFRPATSQSPSFRRHVLLRNQTMSVIQAARATTATPSYFEAFQAELDPGVVANIQPFQLRDAAPNMRIEELKNPPLPVTRKFVDASILAQLNNPCVKLLREVNELHDRPRLTVVSIGTSRPVRVSRHSTPKLVRDFTAVHEKVQTLAQSSPRWKYFRLDSPGDLGLEVDEWEPRGTGERTRRMIGNVFRAWVDADDHLEQIRSCAHQLVTLRRKRSTADEEKWKRFALCQYYVCDESGCEGEDYKFGTQGEFESHLANHGYSGQDMEGKISAGTRTWTYPKV